VLFKFLYCRPASGAQSTRSTIPGAQPIVSQKMQYDNGVSKQESAEEKVRAWAQSSLKAVASKGSVSGEMLF
jgi:hypothetical protein